MKKYYAKKQIKKGDILIYIKDYDLSPYGMAAKKGAEVKVVGFNGEYIKVNWLDKKANGQHDGSYYPDDFEVKK
jgi:uncharacterized Zn ribbon protein